MGSWCLNHWRESSGKQYTHFAQLYISVTDEVKINEQNKSILQDIFTYKLNLKRFDYSGPVERYGGLKPCEVSDVVILVRDSPKYMLK